MKIRYSAFCLVSAVSVAALSCKEKPKAVEATKVEKSVVEKAVEAVKEVVTPKASLTAEERAAKLGFAKYLPADTEMAMSFYNAKQSAEQLKALKLYGILERTMGVDVMMEDEVQPELPDDEMLEDGDIAPEAEQAAEDELADGQAAEEEPMGEAPSPWTLLGQEVTIALGKTTGAQTGRMLKMQRRMSYFQARAMGKAAQEYAKTGKMEDFSDAMLKEMEGDGIVKSLVEDSESGIALLDKTEMPPLYIAFRAKKDELEQATQLVNSSMEIFGMAGDAAVPIELKAAGANFSGFKLLGEKMVEQMEDGRAEMEESLSPEVVDSLFNVLKKKNLIVVTGTVDDYVVMMIGGNEKSMKLTTDVKDSLVGTDELNFTDPFADKQLISVVYGEKELWDEFLKESGMLSTYAIGLRDGISGGGGLGDTRDLEGMLQILSDREKELVSLASANDFGMIAYAEEGLKIEAFGGMDKGAVDWNATTTLSHLGDSADNLIFFNAPSSATYDQKMGDYAEAIFETAYAITLKASSLDIEAPELAEVKQYTQMFDEKFRGDVVGMYEAISSSFSKGLGHESAIVIDLKGAVPAIPGVPQEIVDQGKAPRITFIAPVLDRKKLSESWDEMNTRATSMLAKISEMTEEKIPMQKPISSEKDDMTTWFFSFPFFQDDFMPSVTISDQWFAASTSKIQAVDLINKAKAGGDKGEGLQFYVNFNALNNYADEMLAMMDKNAAIIFTEEYDLENFNENKAEIKEVINACRDFDSLKWTARKENGTMRNTLHFRTK